MPWQSRISRLSPTSCLLPPSASAEIPPGCFLYVRSTYSMPYHTDRDAIMSCAEQTDWLRFRLMYLTRNTNEVREGGLLVIDGGVFLFAQNHLTPTNCSVFVPIIVSLSLSFILHLHICLYTHYHLLTFDFITPITSIHLLFPHHQTVNNQPPIAIYLWSI